MPAFFTGSEGALWIKFAGTAGAGCTVVRDGTASVMSGCGGTVLEYSSIERVPRSKSVDADKA